MDSGDALLMARASDLRDIKQNLQAILCKAERFDICDAKEGTILAAYELTTSLAVGVKPDKIFALITQEGGKTSHMAIIARSLSLPAVSGIAEDQLEEGALAIVDGGTGEIILDPSEEALSEYRALQLEQRQRMQRLERYRGLQSHTADGEAIELFANIGLESDIQTAIDSDAEGVGLFRTEFLFMNRSGAPTEEEQFSVYKKAAAAFRGRPVIIRTLDVGGDKAIPYLGLEKEENPFLGWRAIRYCLDETAVFLTQLRAILRASAFGSVKIMLPMLSSMSEWKKSAELIGRAKGQLRGEGTAFNENIPVGMMIETPAAALLADRFARVAAFFSIGTNDLTQYTMAVDRGNKRVAGLYSAYDPALLRSVYQIAQAAKLSGIPCGICGEAGSDPLLTKFFIGSGVGELSMAGASILQIREVVRAAVYEAARKRIQAELYNFDDAADIIAFLKTL